MTSRITQLKSLARLSVLALACGLAIPALADEPRGYGPGMMGGYGLGMMGGPGPGAGYGGGYGPGMMAGRGGYGYGEGMMGGYGPGMMGGGMMGMGGLGIVHALNLSEQQSAKITKIEDEMRRKNWAVMGRMLDEQAQMRDLFLADKRDPATIGKQSMKLAESRRQMLEAMVDAQNRIEAELSKEQREQLRRGFRRGWFQGEAN